MSDLMDRIIADLVEGARRSEGFMRGSRAGVEVARENRGREEKLANHAALGAGLGGLLLPGIGAPIGAAIGADKGQGLSAAGGTILGGAGGALAGGGIGALLGALAQNPELGAMLGGGLGGVGGALYGAHRGGKEAMFGGAGGLMAPQAAAASMLSGGGAAMRPQAVAPAAKPSGAKPPPLPAAALAKMHASSPFAAPPKMGSAYEDGAKAAMAAFGIKEAIAPALLGLARAALPAAKAVGNFAMKNPVGQQMAGTAGSMAVQRAMTPQQPQPMS
jgi:hypothetical protein